MSKAKYGNKKTAVGDIRFDSKAEAKYYMFLVAQKQQGEIKDFTIQPRFLLQESFRKNGKTHRKLEYVADFQIEHMDGSLEIVDVKGKATTDFLIKEKLFHYRYRDLKLTIIDAKTLQERGKENDGNIRKARRNTRTATRKAGVRRKSNSAG